MADMRESEYNITIDEEDIPVYILAYKSLKNSFRARIRIVLLHVEDDIWEVRLIGLTSREWLEFCATVYAELPSETVNLVEEDTAPDRTYFSEAAAAMEDIPMEQEAEESSEEDGEDELEDEGEEEEETPEAEVQRKLKKVVVRRTGDKSVTVETD